MNFSVIGLLVLPVPFLRLGTSRLAFLPLTGRLRLFALLFFPPSSSGFPPAAEFGGFTERWGFSREESLDLLAPVFFRRGEARRKEGVLGGGLWSGQSRK